MCDKFDKIFKDILIENTEENNIWMDKLSNTEKKIILFGAGTVGYQIAGILYSKNIKPTCFCDNFKSGIDETYGLPIISFDVLKKNYNNDYIIISLGMENAIEVVKELIDAGFQSKNLITRMWFDEKVSKEYVKDHYSEYKWLYDNVYDELSREILVEKIRNSLYYFEMQTRQYNDQYFDKDIVEFADNEVFIDGGAYNGDTIIEFINRTSNEYSAIYSFEPDEKNYYTLVERCKDFKNIKFINKGLWNCESTLKFTGSKKSISSIEEGGNISIQVTTVDEVLLNDGICPTFIKFDIEGSEYKALLGTKQVIQKCKPKLAICIYHKPEDLYKLPKLIKELNPSYKLYLRHYSNDNSETVCYAI